MIEHRVSISLCILAVLRMQVDLDDLEDEETGGFTADSFAGPTRSKTCPICFCSSTEKDVNDPTQLTMFIDEFDVYCFVCYKRTCPDIPANDCGVHNPTPMQM